MINRSYKYRIYPNKEQRVFFAKTFGSVRFFYNKSLSDMETIYLDSGKFQNITPSTYKEDYPFLKEIDSFALCNAQMIRNTMFRRYFNGLANKPKHKSKKSKQSYTTNNHHGSIKFTEEGKYVSVAKCFNIRVKKHRDFKGIIKAATITKTCDNKYFISILTEETTKERPFSNKNIGLDLGVKDLIITSDGIKYENNKYLEKSSKKLSKEQIKLSNMKLGSSNREKQRIKVAKVYDKINRQRNDYLHKISKRIIDENQIICVEDLKVMKMSKNNDYNKAMMDASMSKLLNYLTYKATWYGRTIVKVPFNYPSSQLCSSCGFKNPFMKDLRIRKWVCPKCGVVHDRDINAARNILDKGITIIKKGGKRPDSLSMLGPLGSSSKKICYYKESFHE